jgi:hypothetical protein
MIELDTSIVLDVHIVISIAIAFTITAALFFSACNSVIRFASPGAKQTGFIEIKKIGFYINIVRFSRSKYLFSRKSAKIRKDTDLQLDFEEINDLN